MDPITLPCKVQNPEGDVPGRVSAYWKSKGGELEIAMILGPGPCLLMVAQHGEVAVWEGAAWAPPSSAVTTVRVDSVAGRIQKAMGGPLADAPSTYRGSWKGVLVLKPDPADPGSLRRAVPSVVLVRDLASYAKIGLESDGGKGWRGTMKREGKWFTKAQTASVPFAPFGAALGQTIAGALALVQEACGERDTRRRRAFDPAYAAAKPAAPAPGKAATVDRFGEARLRAPAGYEQLARFDNQANDWQFATGRNGNVSWRPAPAGASPGPTASAAKIRTALMAAWAAYGQPHGLSLPETAKRGPRSRAFRIFREFGGGSTWKTDKGVTVQDAIRALGGYLAVEKDGRGKVFAFEDKSAIAIAPDRWMPVRLLRKVWREQDAEGNVIEGGWTLDPAVPKPAKAPRGKKAAGQVPGNVPPAAAKTPARAAAPPPVAAPVAADAAKDQIMLDAIAASMRAMRAPAASPSSPA